jgi:beta-glucosidase
MQFFTEILTAMAALITGQGSQLTSEQIFPNATYPGAVDPYTENGAQFLQKSDPYYPSPWMTPGTIDWADAYVKAKDFVSQLTLMEKVNLTTGVGYVDFFQDLGSKTL